MPTLKKTGSLLTVAALAASTTLSGPSFAYAEEAARIRLAQAEAPPPAEAPAPAEAPPPEGPAPVEAAPAEAPAPVEQAPGEAPAAVEQAPAEQAAPVETAPVQEPAPVEQAPIETVAPPPEAPSDRPPAIEDVPAPEKAAPAEAPAPRDAAPAEAPATNEPARPEVPPAESVPVEPAPDALRNAPAEIPGDAAPAPDAPAAAAPGQSLPGEGAPADAPPPAPAPPAPAPIVPAPAAPAPAAPAPEIAPPAPGEAVPSDAAPVAPEAGGAPAPAAPADPAPAPQAPVDGQAEPAARSFTPQAFEQPVISSTPVAPLAAPAAERPQPVPLEVQNAPVDPAAIGQSDARVQQLDQPVVIQSVTVEPGTRIEQAPTYALPPRTEVVERVGNRDIIAIAGAAVVGAAAGAAAAYFIRSDDDTRLRADSSERYSERLGGGRYRETIVRPNGVQVVSITNEYGDVIQRSRILPDGREVVLFYDPYAEDAARPDYFYDPGTDLPPLRLNIPRDEYIVDVSEPDEDLYFNTIIAPPVETVERIYSVDEVRRSPRIREKVRRIDLNTINFDFGSAAIPQAQVDNLQALADAVARVIKANPGETFLIEGHTDAVGSNVANLALSDRRAEAVASALTQYFDIPPENLVTQGYGEEDLKVNTQSANRENRRVTLRRITSLVKPVTSARAN